ncbi:pre-rRNA-processing protein TSR2 homolog isoform X2 [Lepidochelys kempii]|uniref:pre-rRNA-processing protein TSR2 homolog isoform X2 n=1 Tax=Lepidochelys kempii TaxID=8472 RepID=UPI003C70395E
MLSALGSCRPPWRPLSWRRPGRRHVACSARGSGRCWAAGPRCRSRWSMASAGHTAGQRPSGWWAWWSSISTAMVSQQLQLLFARCQRGEGPALTEAIARLARRQQEVGRAAAQARPAEGSSSEEEEEKPEEVMDCSSPGPLPDPPPADDGWTVVRKKKK